MEYDANLSSYATPNYYVQKLFSNNKGTDLLKITENGKAVTGQNKLYSSAVFDEKAKEIIIKIVNADSQPKAVILNAKNLRLGGKMIKIILSADTLDTENSFTSEPIQPKENSESIKRGKISTDIPPKSVVILKINKL